MGFGAALLALGAVKAVSQIGQGYAQKAEANYNATVLEGQADLIDVQKDIEFGQYQRKKGSQASTAAANIGASGIAFQGSAMAALISSQTQITIDQNIGQFNLEQDKNYKLAEAAAARRGGKAAVKSGFTNAFTTMLSAGAAYGKYKGGGKLTTAGTVKDTTFDTVIPPYQSIRGSVK